MYGHSLSLLDRYPGNDLAHELVFLELRRHTKVFELSSNSFEGNSGAAYSSFVSIPLLWLRIRASFYGCFFSNVPYPDPLGYAPPFLNPQS